MRLLDAIIEQCELALELLESKKADTKENNDFIEELYNKIDNKKNEAI